MIEKLKALFGKNSAGVGCRFLRADQDKNPFLIDGYDCLAFVNSLIATTADANIARSFVALREDDGRRHVDTLPSNPIELETDLEYFYKGGLTEGVVFSAPEMEQKWDIYCYGNRLYFCRSWRGVLEYVAQFGISESSILVSRIWASGQAGDDSKEFVVREVDYLIKSHMYRRRVPHPLPGDLARDPETVAQYSFSRYGNMCCFGTFEDTLPRDLRKPEALKPERTSERPEKVFENDSPRRD